jgi:cell division protein FtsI (penicillin-binding protein 3)
VIVIDVRSGEVLALANMPSYNPNNRARLTGAQLRNRVITDLFEPGSTLKPFTVALALESGKVTTRSVVETGSGRLTMAQVHHSRCTSGGRASVAQVPRALVQRRHGQDRTVAARANRCTTCPPRWIGSAPELGFPGAAAGKLRPYKSWRPVEQATLGYGMGMSLSLAQLARAYTVFARDGELVPLTLVKTGTEASGKKSCRPGPRARCAPCSSWRCSPVPTGPRARVMGWRVAGKTGTAHKQENGSYAPDKYLSSFVGLAPVSAPRLVVAVMLDEPSRDSTTAARSPRRCSRR